MKPASQVLNMVDGSVDAGLALLSAQTPYGFERTQEEIAQACGCSMQNIQHIERSALLKIRTEIERLGLESRIRDLLRGM
jgi:hypothetical protein